MPKDGISNELRDYAEYIVGYEDTTVFGGVYITHNPTVLHANVVKGMLDKVELPEMEGVVYHEVKYSFAELETAREGFPAFYEKGLSGSIIDSEQNVIRAYLVEDNEELRQEIIGTLPDEDMVVFEIRRYTPSWPKQ